MEWIVGGIQDDKPFLGYVNHLGTSYQDRAICTSTLGDLGVTILRQATDDFSIKINEQKARQLVDDALKAVYARSCPSSSTYYLAIVTKDKETRIEGPFKTKLEWSEADKLIGYD